MNENELLEKLIVGAKIKIGKVYAGYKGYFTAGEIVTLIEGFFDEDNGLYCYESNAPSLKSIDCEDDCIEYDSIWHLFGNKLEHFYDCEIVGYEKQEEKELLDDYPYY